MSDEKDADRARTAVRADRAARVGFADLGKVLQFLYGIDRNLYRMSRHFGVGNKDPCQIQVFPVCDLILHV